VVVSSVSSISAASFVKREKTGVSFIAIISLGNLWGVTREKVQKSARNCEKVRENVPKEYHFVPLFLQTEGKFRRRFQDKD